MKSQKKKKYRIKSRPRFIISIMIMAGLIIAGFNFITGLDETTALEKTKYTEVQVVSGDTLWNIADEYKDNDTDPRDAVNRSHLPGIHTNIKSAYLFNLSYKNIRSSTEDCISIHEHFGCF